MWTLRTDPLPADHRPKPGWWSAPLKNHQGQGDLLMNRPCVRIDVGSEPVRISVDGDADVLVVSSRGRTLPLFRSYCPGWCWTCWPRNSGAKCYSCSSCSRYCHGRREAQGRPTTETWSVGSSKSVGIGRSDTEGISESRAHSFGYSRSRSCGHSRTRSHQSDSWASRSGQTN